MILPKCETVWHGNQAESFALLSAISRNCGCVITSEGVRLETCEPHVMLLTEQRALDGLIYARRIAAQLVKEEWCA